MLLGDHSDDSAFVFSTLERDELMRERRGNEVEELINQAGLSQSLIVNVA